MNTIAISYEQTVALAGRERFWLAAHIQTLPDGHARKRHACLIAVYARDVLTGATPGPYSDADAEHFARLILDAANCGPFVGAAVAVRRPRCGLDVDGGALLQTLCQRAASARNTSPARLSPAAKLSLKEVDKRKHIARRRAGARTDIRGHLQKKGGSQGDIRPA
jgi:hypothetical protein